MTSRARPRTRVTVTADFERNLSRIHRHLEAIGAANRYEGLVDDLLDRVVPLLEQLPALGAPFVIRHLTPEAELLLGRIQTRLARGSLRQLVRGDFVVLYVSTGLDVHLLAIRHQREGPFRIGEGPIDDESR